MTAPRNRTRLLLLILSAVVIVACGALLLYVIGSRRRSGAQQLDQLLAQADYEISLGYHERAMESLERAGGQARGQHNSLRVLKRVYQIAREIDDYALLERFAGPAAESIPGSPELAEIYLYAAIRAQGGARALELLEKEREHLASLQAEAYIRELLPKPPRVAEGQARLRQILALAQAEDPEQNPDPFSLQTLGTDLQDPRIHLDAALLLMRSAAAQDAFLIVDRYRDDPRFREAAIYIAYDAGQPQAALSLIRENDRVDLRLMEADLRYMLGSPAEAMGLYREILADHPGYSWTPYLNLARLAAERGDRQTAYALREQAYILFPDVGMVVTARARSLDRVGRREQAAEILRSYLQTHAEDYRAQLYLLELENTAASPRAYQGALWQLYNRHPESRMLCEHLFLYLLQFNDLSGAQTVLHHYQLATGRSKEPWFLDHLAVLAAVRGDAGQAVRHLRDRILRRDSWQARYNLAVLLGAAGESRQAVEQLIEAENLLDRNAVDAPELQSRIRSRIGEHYLRLGDELSARRECEYAIDLDVSNFHAHRILRILEGE